MLSIGEFSKVTQLTVKTIRLYDEKGLLPPALVSEASGYRYYDQACVERARIIKQLRSLELSLEEIREILRAGADDAEIVTLLEKQAAAIEEKLRKYHDIRRSLRTIIDREKEATMIANAQSFEIERKQLPSILVAGLRATGSYADSGKRFATIGRAVGRHIAGAALNLFYDTEYKETDADFESCFPIKKAVAAKGLSVREIEGGSAVTLVYRGPYDEIGAAYRRLFEYIRQQDLTPKVPSREVYIKGPGMIFKGNPKKYLTEIQVLVEQ